MANEDHLAIIRRGIDDWNQWRKKYIRVKPDLSGADLSLQFLRDADFRWTNLRGANLSRSNLERAKLDSCNLTQANLTEAILYGAQLSRAKLGQTNFSNAQLMLIEALGCDFKDSILTGACVKYWNISAFTKLDKTICEYIFLKHLGGPRWVGDQTKLEYYPAEFGERRPREGTFKPGEFAALFQQALNTIDLIFVDGLDWQSFFASLQEIRQQYDGAEINIQAIEKKSGGAFVVRLEASDSLDKALLQRRLNTAYEENQQLQAQLLKTEGKLEGYKEQLDDFQQKVLQGMNSPKYDLRGAQIAGGIADSVQGDQVGGTINNAAAEKPSLTDVAAEIQNLLKPLETSNPNATAADQTAFLNAMIPPAHRERFIGALKAAGNTALKDMPYSPVLKTLVEGWQRPS